MISPANSSDRIRSVLVVVATAATIFFNGLAATGRLNGVTAGEVSNRYPTVVTPSGFTFTIWLLIYAGLIAFSLYQLRPAKLARFRRIRTLYIASCVLNCVWLWFWHEYMIAACVAVILGLAAVLLVINIRLENSESFADAAIGKSLFGLYFGWVTAAALVNIVILMIASDVQLPPSGWNAVGVGVLVLAALLAIVVRIKLKNYLYPIAIAWASTGIAIKQSGNTAIVVAAAFATVICLVTAGSVVTNLKDSTSE